MKPKLQTFNKHGTDCTTTLLCKIISSFQLPQWSFLAAVNKLNWSSRNVLQWKLHNVVLHWNPDPSTLVWLVSLYPLCQNYNSIHFYRFLHSRLLLVQSFVHCHWDTFCEIQQKNVSNLNTVYSQNSVLCQDWNCAFICLQITQHTQWYTVTTKNCLVCHMLSNRRTMPVLNWKTTRLLLTSTVKLKTSVQNFAVKNEETPHSSRMLSPTIKTQWMTSFFDLDFCSAKAIAEC